MMASAFNGTLYTGVTSHLAARAVQHREKAFDGFTARHDVKRLVYWEEAQTMAAAIAREKQIKRYRRDWKRNLIERENPLWDDMGPVLGLPPLGSTPSRAMEPGTGPG